MTRTKRYWVSPHRSKKGVVTLRGWDVRKVLESDDGLELEGGVAATFQLKKDAWAYVKEQNRVLTRRRQYPNFDEVSGNNC